MTNIIMAFSKPEDGENIKNILAHDGFQVVAVCTSGSQALSAANCLNGGIVVNGYRLEDMMYDELHQCLPGEFDTLLISSPARRSGQSPDRVICPPMPLKVHDPLNTLEMMVQAQERIRRRRGSRPRGRGKEEQDIITEAKTLLMERNDMTESEAHRYMQKYGTDNSTSLVETAQIVISLIHVQWGREIFIECL